LKNQYDLDPSARDRIIIDQDRSETLRQSSICHDDNYEEEPDDNARDAEDLIPHVEGVEEHGELPLKQGTFMFIKNRKVKLKHIYV